MKQHFPRPFGLHHQPEQMGYVWRINACRLHKPVVRALPETTPVQAAQMTICWGLRPEATPVALPCQGGGKPGQTMGDWLVDKGLDAPRAARPKQPSLNALRRRQGQSFGRAPFGPPHASALLGAMQARMGAGKQV